MCICAHVYIPIYLIIYLFRNSTVTFSRAQIFYEEILKCQMGPARTRFFRTNAAIPNRLKSTDMESRFWIVELNKEEKFIPKK